MRLFNITKKIIFGIGAMDGISMKKYNDEIVSMVGYTKTQGGITLIFFCFRLVFLNIKDKK